MSSRKATHERAPATEKKSTTKLLEATGAVAGGEALFAEPPAEISSESFGEVKDVYLLNDRIMCPGPIVCTRSHDVIRGWAADRLAQPALEGKSSDEKIAALRFLFPETPVEGLEPTDWAEWFTLFDEAALVFLYEERADGVKSHFYQFGRPKS